MGNRKRSGQQGNVAPTVAVLLVILLGAVAFSLDMGNIYRVRNELQTAADSAALAAARELDGTSDGITNARAAAKEYALKNRADQGTVTIIDDDIVFGNWDTAAEPGEQWTEIGTSPSTEEELLASNAVRILTQRSQGRADPVSHFFAPILGTDKSDVRAHAIAVGGGPYDMDCTSPLVIGECTFDDDHNPGIEICNACIDFQDNNSDTGGWTTFGDNLGQGTIENLLISHCYPAGTDKTNYEDYEPALDADGVCANSCQDTTIEETLDVGNGVGMNANQYCGVIQDILCRGHDDGVNKQPRCTDATFAPQPFTLMSPVIKGCEFKKGQDLVGYAAITIWGASCGDADEAVVVTGAPSNCTPPPSDKFIIATVQCNLDPVGHSGGGFFGMDAVLMRLVE